MEWSNEVIMEFLDLYEQEPTIWDPLNEDHKDRNKVYDSWKRIQTRFSNECLVKDLKKKKDNLMATFRKLYSKVKKRSIAGSATGEVYKPEWFAYEKMASFLDTVYAPRGVLKAIEGEVGLTDPVDPPCRRPCILKMYLTNKKNLESTRISNRSNPWTTTKYDHGSDSEAEIAVLETECEDDEGTNFQEHASNSRNGVPSKNSTQRDAAETSESDGDGAKQSKLHNDFPLIPRYSKNQPIPCLSQRRNYIRRQERFANERREVPSANRDEDYRRPYSPEAHRGSSNAYRGRYSSDVHSNRKRSRTSNSSCFQEGDEFDIFCQVVAIQLRQLPLERALRCQEGIHSLLMKERIEHCQEQMKNKERVVSCRDRPAQEVVEIATDRNQVFKEESFSFSMDCAGD